MATKLPKLKRNPTGPTKPKAPGKANPTTPQNRPYKWGKGAGSKNRGTRYNSQETV